MSEPTCPECAAGKHRNCTGEAYDDLLDELGECGCRACFPGDVYPADPLMAEYAERALDAALIAKVGAFRAAGPDVTPASCPTEGCPGDVRYAAPGRGHVVGCGYPATAPAEWLGSQA